MMHNGWEGDWGGAGWWVPMTLMMVLFWGGLLWLGVVVLRNAGHGSTAQPTSSGSAPPSARELLDQRLARGEIDVEEYRARLDALTSAPPTNTRRRS